MLKVINLYVIDRIFTEVAVRPLSARSKMFYINCLMHHFRELPPRITQIKAFELFSPELDLYKYRLQIQELQRAELITANDKSVLFHNVWGRHIDGTMLEKTSPHEMLGTITLNYAKDFREEMLSSEGLIEVTAMKLRISKEKVVQMMEEFIKLQTNLKKRYKDVSDCLVHFNGWINKQTPTQQTGVIKSKSNLL